MVVSNGEVKTVSTANSPYTGAAVGDKYIELTIANASSDKLYIPVSSLVEYVTSYVLEKIFGLRWWDYSDRKFNINGRINLTTGIKFGLGSIFLLKILNPFLFKMFDISSICNDLPASFVLLQDLLFINKHLIPLVLQ